MSRTPSYRSHKGPGHAIVQVAPTGENAIVLYGGANHAVSPSLPQDFRLIRFLRR
jgi:hypothetical protein